MSEKEAQAAILEWLSLQPFVVAWRNNTTGIYDPHELVFRKSKSKFARNGVSDILGSWRGRFLAIEVKAPKKRPSETQTKFITDIRKSGGLACVACSIDDVINYLTLEGVLNKTSWVAYGLSI